MMNIKIKSVVFLLFFFIYSANALAIDFDSKPTLICSASKSVGLEYNNYGGWKPFGGRDNTIYKITDSERTGYSSYVKTNNGWTFWSSMDNEYSSAYLVSDGSVGFNELTIDKKDLRFQASYSGGYINGSNNSTWIIIGTCRRQM